MQQVAEAVVRLNMRQILETSMENQMAMPEWSPLSYYLLFKSVKITLELKNL